MNETLVETARGARVRVREAGPGSGQPLLFLHGLAGPLAESGFLDGLADRYRVLAPELPGYGESTGEELLEDMLDFTLHGWDVAVALGLVGRRPHLVGHSLGGMIGAEMACVALAISKLGATWVPINTSLKAAWLRDALEIARTSVVVADHDLYELGVHDVPPGKHIVLTAAPPSERGLR